MSVESERAARPDRGQEIGEVGEACEDNRHTVDYTFIYERGEQSVLSGYRAVTTQQNLPNCNQF